jgi:uncharacterized protein (TIGR02118 family)
VPIALRHHPLMRQYVVNIVQHSPADGDDLDSIGELHFDNVADFRERLYDSPAGEQIVRRDVQGFMGGADAYATTEHIQKAANPTAALGARSPGVKLVCPIRRRPDRTHEQFVDHWLKHHVPLALRHHPGLTKYVTNVVDQRLSASAPELDGIAELHFGGAGERPPAMFESLEGERVIRKDIARFIDHTVAYRVAEYVQKVAA